MMNPSGRILIVDDQPDFNNAHRELLALEGYDVASAFSAEEALTRLGEPGWDVVLLDRKLQGKAGPDTGLDLIAQIQTISPMAKIILITAYADPDSVRRAFSSGVYDYLEKNSYFDEILKVKVGNALGLARERRLASLANGRREEAIRALWAEVEGEKDRHRKGRLLEDLLLVLFKSIVGFEQAEPRQRSIDEELDIVILNESPDPFWQREPSQYLLVECKHWTVKAGPKELGQFRQKIELRHGRCRLGFFVAPGGFTAGIKTQLAARRKDESVIVLIDRNDLIALVEAGGGTQRNEVLKQLHMRSIIGG